MKRVLLTLLAATTLAAAFALPASASAFWLQNLQAEGWTDGVVFEVEVCNARGRIVHVDFDYSNQEEEGLIYHTRWSGRSRYYCGDLRVWERTPMWGGLWGTGVAVTVGRTTQTLEPVGFRV